VSGLLGVGLIAAHNRVRNLLTKSLAGLAIAGTILLLINLTGKWNKEQIVKSPYLKRAASSNTKIHYYREGTDATVSVTEEDDRAVVLRINGKPDASNELSDVTTMNLIAHIPMHLAADNSDVLVIGLGAGVTLGAAEQYRGVERVDCIEISKEVIDAVHHFDFLNYKATADPRVRLIKGDGRNHLLLTDRKYDVILSEPSNPWVSGISNLFTAEFFSLCKAHLKEGGLLGQWVHGYEFSVGDFKSVVKTVGHVFPYVTVWEMGWNDYLIVSGMNRIEIATDVVRDRMGQESVQQSLMRIGIDRFERLATCFVTGGGRLRNWAEKSSLITDDHQILEYSAPLHMYAVSSHEIARELYQIRTTPFDMYLAGDSDEPSRGRLQEYWELKEKLYETRLLLYEQIESLTSPENCAVSSIETIRNDPQNWIGFGGLLGLNLRVRENLLKDGKSQEAERLTELILRFPVPSGWRKYL
jgi:spermidine synthase